MPEDSEKASLLLRILAKAVDLVIIAAAVSIVHQTGYLAGIIYLLISDGLFDGRSLGKKIMRLKVVSVKDGRAGDFRDSILRNSIVASALLVYAIPFFGWILALGIVVFEFLLMLGNSQGMRLGDDLAATKVVNA
ncbi:MAG: RDD family protein [Nitrospirae bacterium]|nr:RDD family protein [Nitrospirota bacterium]